MNALLDESDLVERSRRGDLEAFNSLVALYQDRVYGLCLRMLGAQQAAEDAAQETFLSAYRNVAGMRGPSVRAWLLRIASNACIDELRRRRRHPQLSLDAPTPGSDDHDRALDVTDSEAGPQERALGAELSAALQAELRMLPADQRLAVILSDVQGLSYEEVALAMSSSLGTVKSRISRGRARLRLALQARPELFGDLVRPIDRSPSVERR